MVDPLTIDDNGEGRCPECGHGVHVARYGMGVDTPHADWCSLHPANQMADEQEAALEEEEPANERAEPEAEVDEEAGEAGEAGERVDSD